MIDLYSQKMDNTYTGYTINFDKVGGTAVSEYQVTLLGMPSVFYNGRNVHFPYRKAEGIFYYLCVEKKANRDELISVFWGSGDEDSGRKNLRQALFQIRRCLGNEVILPQGKNVLALNKKFRIRTKWDDTEADFSFCRDRFLDFFYLRDCPEFEVWVESKRRLQISRCLDYIKGQLEDPLALHEPSHLRRLLDTWAYWAPWDEDMALTGMRCYMQAEKYDLGIRLYHEYAKGLREDLEEEPSHAAELLFRTLSHRKEISLMRKTDHKKHFFGRLTELQSVDERIFRFLNHEPSASVIIEGEVGVGKTALMQQIFDMNRGADGLEFISHCYIAESKSPLKSWWEIFKQLENLLKDGRIHLSENSTRLIHFVHTGATAENPDMVRSAEGEYISHTALENGVLNLFRELALQWKLILYFDSLQWMDSVSQRLLQRIMIELGNRQVFMVATCRAGVEQEIRGLLVALSERNIITTLPLLCFTEAETQEIIKEALQDFQYCESNLREIFRRTEGNALALTDTLNIIRREGWKDDIALPRIEMMIQVWLENLTRPQRKVLDALSIYVEHAELEELKLLAKMDRMELIEVLEQLLLTQFVIEETSNNYIIYKFRHRFYKDYIYHRLSLGKRRLWHHAVAEFYETQKNGKRWPKLLPFTILHYERSGDMEKADTLRKLQRDL